MELYEQLERAIAIWADIPYTVACSSGTAALHLALEALQLPPSSEVILPDFTMIACARAIALAGLTPVLVDCCSDLLIDPDLIEPAISDRTSAIMAVHIYGRRCAMEAIHELAGKYGLLVIEDLAEIHGVRPHVNTHAACWSFYRNKIVAGEEGGVVGFRVPGQSKLAQSLRCLGFTEAHDFRHRPRGHNYRLANSLAWSILNSLEMVEENLAQRRAIEKWYDAACPSDLRMPPRDRVWVYDVRLPSYTASWQQSGVVRRLLSLGIAARHAFKPMSRQVEFERCRLITGESHQAALAANEVIYLPVQPGVTSPLLAHQAIHEISRTLD